MTRFLATFALAVLCPAAFGGTLAVGAFDAPLHQAATAAKVARPQLHVGLFEIDPLAPAPAKRVLIVGKFDELLGIGTAHVVSMPTGTLPRPEKASRGFRGPY